MPTKRIGDVPEICLHPDHNPPMHISLRPGKYEHTCAGCGKTKTFTVRAVIW